MVPEGLADVAPWANWSEAADGALRFLYEYMGWDVWVITHVQGDRQVVLRAYPEAVVRRGNELPWERSFCRQMIDGKAPRIATVTAAVPAYSTRCVGLLDHIAAYVGVPLVTADMQLFGTLCGLATRAQPRSAVRELPLVETIARMLSTVLAPAAAKPAGTRRAGTAATAR
jgi:GAF domain-containing protein